ncbi:MAG: tetratricopeptide repeat protein [FCB group bacterium]|nr:tetratricopeptide repeat protein [FCB group bacterium]
MAHKEEFKHDAVRETLAKVFDFLNQNQKKIIQYGPIVLIAILFAAYYNYHQQNLETEANVLFGKALNLFDDGQTDLALLNFQSVEDDYSGTKSADYARLFLIEEALKNGETDKVETMIKELEDSDDEVIRSSVYVLRGNLALNNEDADEAIRFYKKARSLEVFPSLKEEYSLNVIRAYMLKGDYQKAYEEAQKIQADDNLKFNIKNELEDLMAEAKYLAHM